ncbi:DNA-directed DNA polymerase [Coemansia biformis]|uniref:DNA-directed DNA polymerase n=1 Tax=Coemansia biformis TaxID=1286918 RepID=A0A9W8CXS2_9FUNG|nr:DNA-directed DNA polymerase [Coemansia biformis]
MPTTLDFYWDLASLDDDKRVSAATQLIAALCRFQAEMPATDEIAATEEDLDRICAGDVSYGVRRLVKGLASPRDGARQGYSMALAELLARVPCISAKLVLDLLWASTESTRSMKGQEQRDMRFGRVFGMMALVQSGILTRKGTTAVEIRKMVMELAAIGSKKSYMREIAYTTLTAMVPVLGKLDATDELVAMFVAVALDKGTIETPDELLLAMRLRRAYPGHDWSAALPHWQGGHMLNAKNSARVASILCEVSADNTALFSSWHPQLHSVWDDILDLYFNKQRAYEVESLKPMEFDMLWDKAVENGLFAPGVSQFRRYWGFLLLERLLPYLSEENVPAMMTPNIVRTLSDNISLTGKSLLAKVGMRVAERLVEVCEGNTKVGLAVLTHLLNQKSTIQPAGPGKTSLRSMMANRIVAKLDSEALVGYVDYLQKVFLTPRRVRNKTGVADPSSAINVSDKSLERQRAWAIDQMIRVARFGQLPISDELTATVLRFIVAQAAFRTHGESEVAELAVVPVPPLSTTTREYCATALISLVGELSRHMPPTAGAADSDAGAGGAAAAGRLSTGSSRDGAAWPTSAVGALLDIAPRKGTVAVLRDFEETRAVLADMYKVLRAMEKEAAGLAPSAMPDALRVHALELLLGNLCVMAAFAPSAQTRAENLEAIPELSECYSRLHAEIAASGKTPKKRKTRAAAAASDDEPRPVEVLTDMLIGFLTKESNILRRLCEQVFVPFAGTLTASAMESITGVLQAREGDSDGVVATELDAADGMDIDEEDADGADEGSDVDMDGGDAAQMEAVDEELRRKIEEALGADAAAMDEASASGEEEVFDDEQMTVFDDKLAEIFRHKKEQKNAKRDLKITLVNFKLRVLDLADAFLTKQAESPLVIPLLAALLELARATRRDSRSKQIHDRTMAMLGARRARVPRGLDREQATRLLGVVHERARRAADKAEVRMLGSMAAFLSRALLDDAVAGEQAAVIEAVRELNVASMRDFMTHKASQIYVDFFRTTAEKLLEGQLEPLWRVAIEAAAYGHPLKAVNVYRQVQAFALIDTITASASRLAAGLTEPAQIAPFVGLTRELVAALQGALQATIAYAASEENTSAATGRLLLDSQRLREIIRHWLMIVRRCARCEPLQLAVASALVPSAAWSDALAALEASPKLSSPVIKKHCETLADLAQLASGKAPAGGKSSKAGKGQKTNKD